jgi:GxxExxY protein
MEVNQVSGVVVDSAMKVHSAPGPGFLESAYEACLVRELRKRALCVECQVAIPVRYDGETLDVGYRADLLVEDCVLVELKSVETVLPIHKAQLLSYLRLSQKQVGLLINFNVEHLKNGIKRVINSALSSLWPPRPLRCEWLLRFLEAGD